jgi:zinc-binding alcohol dehydrogenase/oxidoreductase
MKAVILHEIGEPEQLRFQDTQKPEPNPGEVLVRIKAAALNRRDVWIRRGRYSGIKLPVILGSDGAGIIAEAGDGVDSSLVGSEVLINSCLRWGENERVQRHDFKILGLPDNGTYAEYVAVPAENIHTKPEHLTWEEAAAIPLAGLTAYRAVVSRAQLQKGQTVLITGIGGGVAVFALQFALETGARVFVTSGSDEKVERAKVLGALGGVNYNRENWTKNVKEMSDNEGVDIVVDSTGGGNFDAVLDVVKPGGTVVIYGSTLGPSDNVTVRRIYWKQLNILGSTMGSPRDFKNMLHVYSNTRMKPVVDSVFPLADTAEAHHRMENAEQFGKIVLRIGS